MLSTSGKRSGKNSWYSKKGSRWRRRPLSTHNGILEIWEAKRLSFKTFPLWRRVECLNHIFSFSWLWRCPLGLSIVADCIPDLRYLPHLQVSSPYWCKLGDTEQPSPTICHIATSLCLIPSLHHLTPARWDVYPASITSHLPAETDTQPPSPHTCQVRDLEKCYKVSHLISQYGDKIRPDLLLWMKLMIGGSSS